jgi:N-acetylneuraminic acid mutarotase
LPNARNHLGAVALDGLIYAIGGQHGHDGGNVEDIAPLHAYDSTTDTWKELAPLPYGRSHFEPGTFVVDGSIAIAGGRSKDSAALYDVTAYDPRTNQWRQVVSLYAPLRAPTAARIGDRIFVGFGGIAPSGLEPQTEWRSCTPAEFGLAPMARPK